MVVALLGVDIDEVYARGGEYLRFDGCSERRQRHNFQRVSWRCLERFRAALSSRPYLGNRRVSTFDDFTVLESDGDVRLFPFGEFFLLAFVDFFKQFEALFLEGGFSYFERSSNLAGLSNMAFCGLF